MLICKCNWPDQHHMYSCAFCSDRHVDTWQAYWYMTSTMTHDCPIDTWLVYWHMTGILTHDWHIDTWLAYWHTTGILTHNIYISTQDNQIGTWYLYWHMTGRLCRQSWCLNLWIFYFWFCCIFYLHCFYIYSAKPFVIFYITYSNQLTLVSFIFEHHQVKVTFSSSIYWWFRISVYSSTYLYFMLVVDSLLLVELSHCEPQ